MTWYTRGWSSLYWADPWQVEGKNLETEWVPSVIVKHVFFACIYFPRFFSSNTIYSFFKFENSVQFYPVVIAEGECLLNKRKFGRLLPILGVTFYPQLQDLANRFLKNKLFLDGFQCFMFLLETFVDKTCLTTLIASQSEAENDSFESPLGSLPRCFSSCVRFS